MHDNAPELYFPVLHTQLRPDRYLEDLVSLCVKNDIISEETAGKIRLGIIDATQEYLQEKNRYIKSSVTKNELGEALGHVVYTIGAELFSLAAPSSALRMLLAEDQYALFCAGLLYKKEDAGASSFAESILKSSLPKTLFLCFSTLATQTDFCVPMRISSPAPARPGRSRTSSPLSSSRR